MVDLLKQIRCHLGEATFYGSSEVIARDQAVYVDRDGWTGKVGAVIGSAIGVGQGAQKH